MHYKIGEWLGAYILKGVEINRKLVYVQLNENEPAKAFDLVHVKKYLCLDDVDNAFFVDLGNALRQFTTDNDNGAECSVLATGELRNGNLRISAEKKMAAKKKKIQDLLKRGTFKVVAKAEITLDVNISPPCCSSNHDQ